QSTLGRLSLRVGTSVTAGNVMLQPFASAGVMHEFQGGASASLTSDFPAVGAALPQLSSTVSISTPRTYGVFGLGVPAQVPDTGWVSYLRGDYRTGSGIEGWSLNGGLRYHFVPGAGGAERAPILAKAPLVKARADGAYDWSGVYVGGYLGAAFGSTH